MLHLWPAEVRNRLRPGRIRAAHQVNAQRDELRVLPVLSAQAEPPALQHHRQVRVRLPAEEEEALDPQRDIHFEGAKAKIKNNV